jgi:hypothetical protein
MVSFGKWDDPEGALEKHLKERDAPKVATSSVRNQPAPTSTNSSTASWR